jgi:hypothetical protein
MSGRSPIDGNTVLSDPGRDGAMMLYDWFKHMTTLSLVTLGGILGILQNGTDNIRPLVTGGIVTTVAMAGIFGFDGLNRLLTAELEGKPMPKVLHWTRRLAMASYGLGVGAFLSVIVETVA